MRQLGILYQVCYVRYQVPFCLWRRGPVLKHCKVPNYYDQDCSHPHRESSVMLYLFCKEIIYSVT